MPEAAANPRVSVITVAYSSFDVLPARAAIPGTTLPDRLPVFQRNGSILPPALGPREKESGS